MSTLFLILLATAAYFAAVSRDREGIAEAEAQPVRDLLTIELEKEDDGRYHAIVLDIGDDSILHVTDSYADISDAVKASQNRIETNG